MPELSAILFAGPDAWQLVVWPSLSNAPTPIPLPPGAGPAEIAATISTALKTAGMAGKPVAIGISSDLCLSALISTADLPRNDRKAMLYRLEENLPLPAESVVADFIVQKDSALGVCARLDVLSPLIAAFDAADIPVQSIFPTALATTAAFTKSEALTACVLLCRDSAGQPSAGQPSAAQPSAVNVIGLVNRTPAHWALVPATAADVSMQLDLLSAELGAIPHIHALDLDPALVEALVETTARVIDVEQQGGLLLAGSFAADVLRGRAKHWIEFRRDQLAMGDPLQLYRRWIDRSLVAAIALLLSLTLVCLVRAHRYQESEDAANHDMARAFHEHFPGWEAPVHVRAIVDAQYRLATGKTSGAAPAGGAPHSALTSLHDVLLPMVEQDHLQISRMAFHENSFEITGKVQAYEQLDGLSKRASVDGMVVPPPQAHKESDGSWTFLLQGSRPADTRAN